MPDSSLSAEEAGHWDVEDRSGARHWHGDDDADRAASAARIEVLEGALRNLIADAYAHNPKDATGSIRAARAALSPATEAPTVRLRSEPIAKTGEPGG